MRSSGRRTAWAAPSRSATTSNRSGPLSNQAEKGESRSNPHRGGTATEARLTPQKRDVAREAAKVLRLEGAGVDLLQTKDGPKVLEVNSSPGLKGIEKATGKDLAARIIEHLETVVRPLSRHREPL